MKHITSRTWVKIKTDYTIGKLSINKIAKKHKISTQSIYRRAKKECWEFGSLSDEVSREIEKATIKTVIEDTSDSAAEATRQYLKDSEKVRSLTIAIMDGLAKELIKSGNNVSRAEAERILFCQRVNETTSKTILSLYQGNRKALGLPDGKHEIGGTDGGPIAVIIRGDDAKL